ncbi:hypothetical protein Sps_04818 [Shewanella psychrophila]|uniref:DNA-binding protein H-NS-like N-terminal domain-containing protein n=1 Tax=Shewanella psychrophila TaxID=225848 RepID=A0A1S6HWF7_9GAMM|nr:hypothetical protein Sps_04818 [Shewanella psychrophila]
MTDFLNLLTHENTLKDNTEKLSIDELKVVASRLQLFIAHREMQSVDDKVERNAHIMRIRKQMYKIGLRVNDVRSAIKAPRKLK